CAPAFPPVFLTRLNPSLPARVNSATPLLLQLGWFFISGCMDNYIAGPLGGKDKSVRSGCTQRQRQRRYTS
ncbi:hypothetical protein RBJ04_21905, partial [Klebsiella michiganensis]|uniref:hypothetical protein n=1 Tax=Klebsiella michiganensis TaxID=1134687 RepID=UPI0027CDD291